MAFIVYNSVDNAYYTIGKLYLVNKTTNALDLIKDVYNKFDDISVRYEFQASDNLIIRYWPLTIKVKDPKFSISKLDTAQLGKLKKGQKNVKSKYLSSNFVPLTMEFQNFYGQLISKKGNTF